MSIFLKKEKSMKNTFLVTFITVCCSLFIFSIDAARLFIALDLPPNVNSSIMNFQSSLSKKLPLHLPAGINFDKSQINLTILFIGEADRSKAETALLNAFQDKENKSGLCQKWTLACNPSLSLNQYIDLKASPQNLNTFNSFIEKIKTSWKKEIDIKEELGYLG